MSPSLSGNPFIITAICSHLPPPTLSRMLRVDKQCFHIAGKALYRYLTVNTIGDGRRTLPPVEAFYSQKLWLSGNPPTKSGVGSATKVALLAMIEVLDITEEAALRIANNVQPLSEDLVAVPHPLRNMKTLVLRSEVNPRTADPRQSDGRSFGDGWAPELIVFIGSSKALIRVLNHPRDDGPKWGRLSWPPVRRLQHLSPFPLPTDTAVAFGERSGLSTRLKNLTSYDLYYDVQTPTRHPRIEGDMALSFKSCGLREFPIIGKVDYKRRVLAFGLAAAILDCPPDIKPTLWLPNKPAIVVRNSNFRTQAAAWLTHMLYCHVQYNIGGSVGERWDPFLEAERVDRELDRILGEVVDGGAWPAGPVFPSVPTVDRTSEEWRKEAVKKRVKAGIKRTWWFPDPTDGSSWNSDSKRGSAAGATAPAAPDSDRGMRVMMEGDRVHTQGSGFGVSPQYSSTCRSRLNAIQRVRQSAVLSAARCAEDKLRYTMVLR
ncbi:uncharacterized protein MKK02DRAFT_28122 [Dioszegia hungarica]|uniref:Uncharacterized protein n=1 Tax=Dioszegia hungarica TaxID=4972 RepID=A0AA38LUU1_9TREE|nr:uncharacterized protein MKK02DRAFT_28122 [Dioszegia hungarica]KAI9634366.1 hypothetical protein MKK02DRAFT_28122 [Dioszegia hungarica]